MTAHQRQRLILIGCAAGALMLAIGLTVLALRENINLFVSPSQVQAGEAPAGVFRVGGMVVPGSVQPGENLALTFRITDFAEEVTIDYRGLLPDLFGEGEGVVAEGRWQNGRFQAVRVLAKHDENYMPAEVKEALKASGAGYGNE